MNEIMSINGMECYEQDGTAYLKLETVARGLGFTQTQNKNGTEYISVRWERVEGYLEEFGFPHKWGKDDFIPENIFYRLAMKAKNETAERFQALVADEIIPSIRKTGGYQLPQMSKELRAIIMQDQKIQEVENRVNRVQEDLDEFKEEMPLLALDCDRISRAVHIKGVECLGGKDSMAYQDRSLRAKVYSDLHREIKRQFGVTTYKAIRRNQCDNVCRIVSEYELPMVLQEQVEAANTNMLLY